MSVSTEFNIAWEVLKEGLSRSGWPVGMPVRIISVTVIEEGRPELFLGRDPGLYKRRKSQLNTKDMH